jgi:hypothetical protein
VTKTNEQLHAHTRRTPILKTKDGPIQDVPAIMAMITLMADEDGGTYKTLSK